MSRRNKSVQSAFAKQMLQSQRTKRNNDSSVIKDKDLPLAQPDNVVGVGSPVWFSGHSHTSVPNPTLPVSKSDTPIVCYRGWDLVKDERGPALRSVTANVIWDGPILRGGGKPTNGIPQHWGMHFGPPDKNSDFGIFAYRSASELLGTGMVWGEIEVFGKVVVHETGLRAENARIRRILIPRTVRFYKSEVFTFTITWGSGGTAYMKPEPEVTDDTLVQLAERYQCDVAWWNGPF